MKRITRLFALSLIAALTVLFASCGKDKNKFDDPRTGYPKNVTIQYKITPVSGTTAGRVVYTNETGADTDLPTNTAIPFTKTITKKVAFAEILMLTFSSSAPGSAKLEILVDNKVVSTATPSGANDLVGVIQYQFGSN